MADIITDELLVMYHMVQPTHMFETTLQILL